MSKNIVVVGSSNTDMIVKVDKIPKPGETIIGGKFFKAAGGKGANQAVAAARAGGDVTFVASVGDDTFGNDALQGFEKEGINIDNIKKDKSEASGIALIFIDKEGENSIGVASGANLTLQVSDIQKSEQVIKNADVLLMQLETPVETIEAAAKIASEAGVKVILNPAPAQPLRDELLKSVSVFTPNESETELLTGVAIQNLDDASKAADILIGKGIETVIITLGSKGVFVAYENKSFLTPAFEVEAIDTTAAGDVFNGSLAVALSEGKSIGEAVLFANAAAALSVTKIGAQPSAPSKEEIEKFLNK
jgi:ribokinase